MIYRTIRVIIADDQLLFAESLSYVLKGISESIEVVAIARDGNEAVRLTELHRPDLVLMDVRMPEMDGVEATRRIREQAPGTKIVILTTFDDDEYVHYALKYGAVGYLLKNIRPDDLVVSMRAVMAGASLFAPAITSRMGGGDDSEGAQIEQTISQLSRRERDVLGLVMRMMNNRQIGIELGISEHSVRNYISGIYAAFGVNDRMVLIQRLSEHWHRLGL
jgi:DNA-binding NarL/FixJ family response regulator